MTATIHTLPAPRPENVLDAALALATRGLHLFPCKPADKTPLTEHGFYDASIDCEVIRAWWARYPDAMIGVRTGAVSGLWVLDFDIKPADGIKPAVNGREAFMTIAAGRKLPRTPCQGTPGDGWHFLFKMPPDRTVKSTTGKIATGIDTRGDGGYICIAPSARADGKRYSWKTTLTFFDTPLADAPDWLLEMVDRVLDYEGSPAIGEGDIAPGFKEGWADQHKWTSIEQAPPAFRRVASAILAIDNSKQGRGDLVAQAHAIVQACNRNEAIYSLAFEPLCLQYEGRVPMTQDDARKIWDSINSSSVGWERLKRHASGYGWTDPDPGADTEETFAEPASNQSPESEAIAEPSSPEPKKTYLAWRSPSKVMDSKDIKRREWVIDKLSSPDEVAVMIATGGVGKTTLAMEQAVAIISGRDDIIGMHIAKPGAVLFCCNEETGLELDRKYFAISDRYKLPREIRDSLHFVDTEHHKLTIAAKVGGVVTASPVVEEIIAHCLEHAIVALFLDPFVSLAKGISEDDNADREQVMSILRYIATKAHVAVTLLHHTSKDRHDRAGDQNAARGASAVVDAARLAYTLTLPTATDMKDFKSRGIEDHVARRLLSLTGAKANHAPRDAATCWYVFEGQNLENGPPGDEMMGGDSVGMLLPFTLPAVAVEEKDAVELAAILGVFKDGDDTLYVPKAKVRLGKALGVSRTQLYEHLDGLLPIGEPRRIGDWTLTRTKTRADERAPSTITRKAVQTAPSKG